MKIQIWTTLAAFALLGSETRAQNINVSMAARSLEVEVSSTTSLKAVLAAFCAKTHSDCTGVDVASDLVVPAGSIRGGWTDIVGKLLAGSSLDYIAAAPNGMTPGRLILQAKTTSTQVVSPPMPSATQSSPEAFEQPARTAQIPDPAQPPAEVSDNPAESASMLRGMSSGADGSAGMGASQTGSSPLTTDQAQPTEPSASYFPFPNRQGQLMPLPAKGGYVPFPTSNGQLIPMPQTSGSPFPSNSQPH